MEYSEKAIYIAPDDVSVNYNVACHYSQLEHGDEAHDPLKESVDNGFTQKAWVENVPDLDNMRKPLLQRNDKAAGLAP